VMRVLPRENEAINECWLSDKDRFSYEGLNSEQRLARPMVKQDGVWREVEWQFALDFVAQELKRIRDQHGAQSIGALATPHQTVEELHLLQKVTRRLGSGNVDFRLRQSDFGSDGKLVGAPWLGMKIAEVGLHDRVLVIGSTLRKDHPLLAHRLRQATKRGTQLSMINPFDDDLLMPVAHKIVVRPSALAAALAGVVKAAAEAKNAAVPESVRDAVSGVEVDDKARAVAGSLASGQKSAIFLGNLAQHHPQAAQLHALAQALAEVTGARLGFLGEAANSVGGYVAHAVPFGVPAGKSAAQMLTAGQGMKAYLLLGVEAELDTHNPQEALAALKQAELVVVMSAYQHQAVEYANVLLPIGPFTETAGTFINTEGTIQSFNGVVQPLGEARPAWKVLRVLGNLLDLEGFEHDSADDVTREALGDGNIGPRLNNRIELSMTALPPAGDERLERIGEVPLYSADAIVRRSPPLQMTRDAAPPLAWLNAATASALELRSGDFLRVRQGAGEATVGFGIDDRLPPGCIRLAAARPETAGLGSMFGAVSAERVAGGQKVAM